MHVFCGNSLPGMNPAVPWLSMAGSLEPVNGHALYTIGRCYRKICPIINGKFNTKKPTLLGTLVFNHVLVQHE